MLPFFDKNASADDLTYINMRDGNDPDEIAERKLCESLWAKYRPCADGNFLSELRKNFDARFWEMYLGCTLMENGYKISHKDEGPDFRIEDNGTVIWIEAVTATSGDPSKPDSVPPLKYGITQDVPDKQMILRYRNAIQYKYCTKYFKYLKGSLVAKDDCYVIALNGCPIPHRHKDYEPPRIVRSVFPIGWQVVTIDTTTHTVLKSGYEYRANLMKRSGSIVETDIFTNTKYEHLSAILFSNIGVANPTPDMGDDFIIVRNPLALKQLPDNFPRVGLEYKANLSENTIIPKSLR